MRILTTLFQAIVIASLLYGIVLLLFLLAEPNITSEMQEQTRNITEWRERQIEQAMNGTNTNTGR